MFELWVAVLADIGNDTDSEIGDEILLGGQT